MGDFKRGDRVVYYVEQGARTMHVMATVLFVGPKRITIETDDYPGRRLVKPTRLELWGPDAFWVYAEDLAGGLIGPFKTEAKALEHIQFCITRGDGAVMKVVTDTVPYKDVPRMTPEEDRAFKIDETLRSEG